MNSTLTMTDMFCGCGGSSTGAVDASTEMEVIMAMNHWKLAVETHNTNHPNTRHDCCDLSAVDPRRYPRTSILWASPECTNHSLAKGRKRKNLDQMDIFAGIQIDATEERSRATMWDVPRFAEYHMYDMIVVENVVDARRWVMWPAWLHAMHCLGYEHKAVYLNSMVCHPTPQSRDRLYVVFWRQGIPAPDLDFHPTCYCSFCDKQVEGIQSWRNTKIGRERWGKLNQQYDYRCPVCAQVAQPLYYAAFNIIDWSLPAERIGDRSRPLKPKTYARVKYGLEKYGNQTLIIATRYTSGVECRVRSASGSPMTTLPADVSHAVTIPSSPFVSAMQYGDTGRSVDAPLQTLTTQESSFVINPIVMPNSPFLSVQYSTNNARSMDDPTATEVATQHSYLVSPPPVIAELRGASFAHSSADPLGCVTAGGGHHALVTQESVRAFMSHYYGTGVNASGLDDAQPVVTTRERSALITMPTENVTVEDCTFRMLQPHESQRAMAFPDDYVVLGKKKEQVKQLGNAVTPPVAREILKRCIQALTGERRSV